MKYTKIRVEFKEFPKRLYREMYVRSDISLYNLGVCILCSVKATFEHYFLFQDSVRDYVPKDFEELYKKQVYMTNYHLKDVCLNNKKQFFLVYDTGDYYEFTITVLEEVELEKKRKLSFIISGAGDRIWEDNIYTLYAYLNGKLKDELTEEDVENGYSMPWNVPGTYVFSDFDRPYFVKQENNRTSRYKNFALKELKKNGVNY